MTYAIRVAGSERVFERAPVRNPRAGGTKTLPRAPKSNCGPTSYGASALARNGIR